ncbi:MAG: hypothetical protein WAN66_03225 [Limnoraphis robusta]|uniref:hypothetical protein n=1 Tax=Limnoraphis robusta TaxID=1118279 RepID=UPI00066A6B8C|nr:hypothetical protein [Limnoraphis robusta]
MKKADFDSYQAQKKPISVLENTNSPTTQNSSIKQHWTPSTTEAFQEKLNSLPSGAIIELWPPNSEFSGPILLNRPITIEGKGASIWSQKGPVILIQSEEVTLRNLIVEVTGENNITLEEQCAVQVKSGENLKFEDIKVRGTVMGLPQEEGEWKYPETLHLGQLSSGNAYQFLLRLIVPVDCQLVSNISGVDVEPTHLNTGHNEVKLYLEELPENILINGNLFIISANFKRRIVLTANIVSRSEEPSDQINSIIWQPEDWLSFTQTQPPQVKEESQPVIPSYSSPSIPFASSKIRRGEQPNSDLFKSEINPSQEISGSSDESQKPKISDKISDLFGKVQEHIESPLNSIKLPSIPQPKKPIKSVFDIFTPKPSEQQDLKQSQSSPISYPEENCPTSSPINPIFLQNSSDNRSHNSNPNFTFMKLILNSDHLFWVLIFLINEVLRTEK